MRPEDRVVARRQLGRRLGVFAHEEAFIPPPRGWVKAIRESLGMTTAQLAKRLGVSQPRVVMTEKAEVTGAITLESLKRVAQALDCRLVYALVPRQPLEKLVEERAHLVARKRLESVHHTMVLEAQGVEAGEESEQIKRIVRQLIEKSSSRLWDDLD